jgi:hypothetical protein
MSWIGGLVALVLLHAHTMRSAANRGGVVYTCSTSGGSTAVLHSVYYTSSCVGLIGVLGIAVRVIHVAHGKEGNACQYMGRAGQHNMW